MSFGFGFALPAYPLRGGGGNNPFNQLGPTLDLSFVDGATNVGNQLGADTYTLNTDFITPEYQVAAQYAVWVAGSGLTQRNFADIVTFTRGTAATQFDSTGTLIFAPMNAIRNNMMVGAVAGTPGTPPTNWGVTTTGGSITRTIVGTGTENGITYIDIRYVFTGAATAFVIPQTATEVAALTGQTWTASSYAKLVAGSLTNLTAQIALDEYSSVPAFLVGSSTPFVPTGAALSTQRFGHTRALNNASTAFVVSSVQLIASGAADITLRIGLPQLERGSVATAVNETSGTAYYGPRFDYNPSTLAAQGLLIEEQRTNSIRNNTMQGAVAGTPGTLPNNWQQNSGTVAVNVVGTGAENGITYIDLQFVGTPNQTFANIRFEPNTQIVATNGQTWTSSFFVRRVAGSTTNITEIDNRIYFRDAGGSGIQESGASILSLLSNSSINNSRTINSLTAANASIVLINNGINFGLTIGAVIDITLRIGLPQLELGAFATSVIPTTVAQVTRSADVASVNTLSPWFNASASTILADYTLLTSRTTDVTFARFDDGSDANRIQVATGASFTVFNSFVIVSNVSQGGNTVSINPLGTHKTAFAVTTNDSVSAADGTVGTPDTTVTLPSGLTRFSLGNSNAAQFFNGYLRRITYYPRRLANADLQTITT